MRNAEVFASTICSKLGSRRAGDQIGALLAGAYTMSSDGEISSESAIKWVDSQDWTEQEEISNGGGDSRRCLDTIMTHVVRLTPTRAITVSEMLQECQKHYEGSKSDGWPEGEPAEKAELSRMGIRLEADEGLIYIAEGHDRIKDILRDSPHAGSYSRILQRLKGNVKKQSMRFTGCVKRATGIPWNAVFGEAAD
jgi:putative DNA primase/helicase